VEERDVRAVEQDVGRDVRRRDPLAEERHVDDAERRHGAGVRQLDLLGGRRPVGRAGAARRDVDLPARRAPLADELPLGERRVEERLLRRGGIQVLQLDRHHDAGDRVDRLPRLHGRTGLTLEQSLEALDVGDCPDPLHAPPDTNSHIRVNVVGGTDVERVEQGGVRTVQRDQHERERPVQGLTLDRFRHPRPRRDGSGVCDLDEVVDRQMRDGVVFRRRYDDPAIRRTAADHHAVPQSGQEATEHRTGRPGVVERYGHRRGQRAGHGRKLEHVLI
jgi:hypothetical protein